MAVLTVAVMTAKITTWLPRRRISQDGAAGQPPATIRSACLHELPATCARRWIAISRRSACARNRRRCCCGAAACRARAPASFAVAVGTDTAGITGLLDHLEKHGLVSRRAEPGGPASGPRGAHGDGPRPRAAAARGSFRPSTRVLLAGFSPPEAAILESHAGSLAPRTTSGRGSPRRRISRCRRGARSLPPRPGAPQGGAPHQNSTRGRQEE